jgi:hypothetical protein
MLGDTLLYSKATTAAQVTARVHLLVMQNACETARTLVHSTVVLPSKLEGPLSCNRRKIAVQNDAILRLESSSLPWVAT